MRSVLRKPYLICWLTLPVLVLIGLVFGQHIIDIHLYDTYYVVANEFFISAGSVLLLFLGIGYWLLKLKGKTPNGILTTIHLLLTIGVLLLFSLPVFSANSLVSSEWILFSVIALLLGQLTYVVNILTALLQK
ncbi:hypothetical protein [Larkinella arboricola]